MDLVFDCTPEDIKVFIQEADELIQQLDENVLRLEKEGQNPDLMQEIFRAAHTLKGSSGMLGHERMAKLTHAMETLFDRLRKDELAITTELIDLLLDCLGALKILKEECNTFKTSDINIDALSTRILSFTENSFNDASGDHSLAEISLNNHDIDIISRAEMSGSQAFSVKVKVSDDCPMPSVRLFQVIEELGNVGQVIKTYPPTETIENGDCGFEAEIILVADEDQSRVESTIKPISELSSYDIELYLLDGLQPNEAVADGILGEVQADKEDEYTGSKAIEKSRQEAKQVRTAAVKTVRIDVERLDHLMNLVGELVIGKTRLVQIGSELADNHHLGEISGNLNEVTAQIGQITNELQEEVMRARMLPIEQVFNKFPRMVRDLARSIGKSVDFVIEGKETEIDRSVLEEIGDPLIHILRNAIDHGIELSEERLKAGKTSEGHVYLCARHEENHIVIEVSDDGRGMDPVKLKEKAINKGFVTPEMADKMSDRDIYDLVFLSGFSTARNVSEISGRGVGMDVVRNNIKKINGSVQIESEPGKGTRFLVKLPLTLVIVDALVVSLSDKLYAIPLGMIKEVLRLGAADIKRVDKMETTILRGNVLPLLRLSGLFDHNGLSEPSDKQSLYVVVIGYADNKVGLVVDGLVSKMEIMIKSLGEYLGDVDGISGATILGDGRVALVVDPISLVSKIKSQPSVSGFDPMFWDALDHKRTA